MYIWLIGTHLKASPFPNFFVKRFDNRIYSEGENSTYQFNITSKVDPVLKLVMFNSTNS